VVTIAWDLKTVVGSPVASDNLLDWIENEHLLFLVLNPSSKVDMVVWMGFNDSIHWQS
jgi:hypothetical protein